MNTTFDWLLKLRNNLKTNQISYSSLDRVKNYSGVMVEFAGSGFGLRILTKNSFRIIVKPLLCYSINRELKHIERKRYDEDKLL